MQPRAASWQSSKLFLIDMPVSFLLKASPQLSTLHLRMAIIDVSSSSLIDMPISMLEALVRLHRSTLQQGRAIINVSRSFLIDKPISMLETTPRAHLSTLRP